MSIYIRTLVRFCKTKELPDYVSAVVASRVKKKTPRNEIRINNKPGGWLGGGEMKSNNSYLEINFVSTAVNDAYRENDDVYDPCKK